MTSVDIPYAQGDQAYLKRFIRAVRPKPVLTVSQWADKHRVMTSKSSGQKGPWRTSLVPFAREPMDCLSVHSTVSEVTLMKPAQSAGSEIALNWIGYTMDYNPGPMLYVLPNVEPSVDRFVKQRLNPMLIDTEVLANMFDAKRQRDGSNSKLIKDYPGGILIMGGANSPASLAMMPIRDVVVDEFDRFAWEVGKEGDPDGLIEQRQATFKHRKKLNISTPTVAGASRIDDKYKLSDQRQYYMPCPHCGEFILFKWPNLQWNKQLTHAWYACEKNGCVIEEHAKTEMLKEEGYGGRAKWIAKFPDRSSRHRGYHWNALYAPIGLGFRWIELVRQWIEAQDDKAKLKRFINTVLAEVWEDRTRDVKPNHLMERAEPYKLKQIPPGCLILTCAIDVQDDRLELGLEGWGRNERNWKLDYHVIPGNPARLFEEAQQKKGPLFEYLTSPIQNSFGRDMFIQATAVDTGGHYTHEVYNFVRSGIARRLMAVKGANTPGKPILVARPTAQDVNYRGKVIQGGVLLWTVGTDTAKHRFFNQVMGDQGLPPEERKVHFSEDLDEDYYNQVTAEAFDPERNKWVKRRNRRNEGLDLTVYNAAASQHPEIRVHAITKAKWDYYESILQPPKSDDGTGKPAPIAIPPGLQKKGRRVRSKGVGS